MRTNVSRAAPVAGALGVAMLAVWMLAGWTPATVVGQETEAQGGRLAPGSPLEIVVAQADLLAMPPGFTRDVKARVQNRFGVALRGARFVLVSETENYYQVALECQDGKIQIGAWLDKTAARPAPEKAPGLPR